MTDAAVTGARRREPPDRRTFQPCRGGSRLAGTEPPAFRARYSREQKRDALSAVEIYDRVHKKPGDRRGPVGGVGREILRALWGLACSAARGGDRLIEPSIAGIARLIRRSRSATAEGLARLQAHGFVDWMRRVVLAPDAEPGVRGPQVAQTSNAYLLRLPPAAARLLRRTPAPEDDVARRADQDAARRWYGADAMGLVAALDRIGAAVLSRDQSAGPAIGRNPGQEVK